MWRIPRDQGRHVTVGLSAVLLIGLVPAISIIRDESAIHAAQDSLEIEVRYLADRHLETALPLSDYGETPRGRILDALLLLARAQRAPAGTTRDRLLSDAETRLSPSISARPYWGEARVVQAAIAQAKYGDDDPATLEPFARSYRDAPFLRDAALWRVGFGFANWAILPDATRNDVTREAIWLSQAVPGRRRQVFDLARETDAYIPFTRAWRQNMLDRNRMRAQ